MHASFVSAFRVRCLVVLGLSGLLAPVALSAQATRYPLTSTASLRPHNVIAEPATFQGKKGLKVMAAAESAAGNEELVLITDLEFGDGVIEVEIAGGVRPGSAEGARGFVGVAFRVQNDLRTYDAFYLRPTHGRADDQVRRNHAVQYISHPDWTWSRLRQEFPGKYESYGDLLPATWTRVKIEVRGQRAWLYLHDMEQPTLIVNDLKSGAHAKGAVALWIGPGTIAHFRNLRVSQ